MSENKSFSASDDLDSMLDDALNDFEAMNASRAPPTPAPRPSVTPAPSVPGTPSTPLTPLFSSFAGQSPARPAPTPGPGNAPVLPEGADFENFAETLKKLAEGAKKLEDEMQEDEGGDDFMEKLMKEFESNEGYSGMVENMMKQLISKDVLYEPMKEMYEKYPGWLAANKGKLPAEEYQNYVKQYGYIEQIMYIYDSKGDAGSGEVVKLMREMQDCGQVPPEIVKQMAPDLEFGQDGMPKFPGLEGMPPMPDGKQCSIM